MARLSKCVTKRNRLRGFQSLEPRQLLAGDVVQFDSTSFEISESGESLGPEISVTRSSSDGEQSIGVRVAKFYSGIVGFAGKYFNDQDFTVQFAEGETTKTIPISSLSSERVEELSWGFMLAESTDKNSLFTLEDDDLFEMSVELELELVEVVGSGLLPSGIVESVVTLVDNDPRQVLLSPIDFDPKVVVGGVEGTVAARLNFRPDQDVFVTPSTNDVASTATPQLRFTPDNWHLPQSISLKGLEASEQAVLRAVVDDALSDPNSHEADAEFSFTVEAPVMFQDVGGFQVGNLNRQALGLDPRDLVVFGDEVFFTGDDGIHGRELWKSDGTDAGTVLIKDIRSGDESAFPSGALHWNRSDRGVLFKDEFYFVADTPEPALWKTDGTEDGTQLVRELVPQSPREIVATAEKLFVRLERSIWTSDGTADETKLILEGEFLSMTPVGSKVYAFDRDSLWVSESEGAGPTQLAPAEAYNSSTAIVGDTLFFAGGLRRDMNGNGIELWKTDGTLAGTMEVRNISLGVATVGVSGPGSSSPLNLVAIDDEVYFRLQSPLSFENGERVPLDNIWKTDGTEAGTVPVLNANFASELFAFDGKPYLVTFSDGIRSLDNAEPFTPASVRKGFVRGDSMYFSSTNDRGELSLWRSDGTSAGTKLVFVAPGDSIASSLSEVVATDDTVFFDIQSEAGGSQLWSKSGSAEASVVRSPSSNGDSNPHNFTIVGESLFFTAEDGDAPNRQLWRISGEEPLASIVSVLPDPFRDWPKFIDDSPPQLDTYDLAGLVAVGDQLVFTHDYAMRYASHYRDLWVWDSESNQVEMLGTYDIAFKNDPPLGELRQVTIDGTLYLGNGLRYDGVSRTALSMPASQITANGEQIFFSSFDAENGQELWVTNDAFESSARVSNIGPGNTNGLLSYPWSFRKSEFVVADDKLVFTAVPDAFGDSVKEIWISDGTLEGTTQLFAGDQGRHLSDLVVVGDYVLFRSGGHSFYSIDVPAGTTSPIRAFDDSGSEQVVMDGIVYFAARDRDGMELWRSDGTREGTHQVADIRPGVGGSEPGALRVVDDRLFFAADDGVNGREVWSTDGTSEGTRLYADVDKGAGSSDPTEFTPFDGSLYFAADVGSYGTEVWRIPLDIGSSVDGDVNGDAKVDFADFLILSGNFGQETAAGANDGDFDSDGIVSFADFLVLSQNYGRTFSAANVDHVFLLG